MEIQEIINLFKPEGVDFIGTVSKCKRGYVCKLPKISLATGKIYYLKFYGKTKLDAIRKRDIYILEKEVLPTLSELEKLL